MRPLYEWSDDNISRRVTVLLYTVRGKRVHCTYRAPGRPVGIRDLEQTSRHARRVTRTLLAFLMDRAPDPPKEDERQTRRDLRAALVFGIVAAAIELGVILYFFR